MANWEGFAGSAVPASFLLRCYDKWCMKLPNGDKAIVDLAKLLDYCLNPRGRNKARVFASIGIQRAEAEYLPIRTARGGPRGGSGIWWGNCLRAALHD